MKWDKSDWCYFGICLGLSLDGLLRGHYLYALIFPFLGITLNMMLKFLWTRILYFPLIILMGLALIINPTLFSHVHWINYSISAIIIAASIFVLCDDFKGISRKRKVKKQMKQCSPNRI